MVISLRDIQSIKEATYNLGDKGVTVIVGDNSNGKSVLGKAIGAIVNLKILDNDEREALINDNADFGIIAISYQDRVLTCKVHRERNKCIMQLKRDNGEKIVRTFREGGIPELIDEFGFCCYNNNSVCLQLYETFGLMPFVNTSTKTNGEIVEDITEDSVAKRFLNNYKEFTYKEAVKQNKEMNMRLESAKRVKDSLVMYDSKLYESYFEMMNEVYENLKYLEKIEVAKLRLVPTISVPDIPEMNLERLRMPLNIKLVDIKPPTLNKFVGVKVLPKIGKLRKLNTEIEDLLTVLNGKCPTCGKRLLE